MSIRLLRYANEIKSCVGNNGEIHDPYAEGEHLITSCLHRTME